MQVVALVPAAGQGSRLGGSVPKQFLTLCGRTILDRTVSALARCERIDLIVVAVPAGHEASPPPYLAALEPRVTVVAGGPRRQDSVARAFASAPATAQLFLVHDAARPFVDRATIDRTLDAAAASGAAVAALPARDTVKLAEAAGPSWADGGRPAVVTRTLLRERIFLAQTPQAFTRDVLARALQLAASGAEATDEAALAEQAGCRVVLVPGDPANIKITTGADLAFARGVLLERGERC